MAADIKDKWFCITLAGCRQGKSSFAFQVWIKHYNFRSELRGLVDPEISELIRSAENNAKYTEKVTITSTGDMGNTHPGGWLVFFSSTITDNLSGHCFTPASNVSFTAGKVEDRDAVTLVGRYCGHCQPLDDITGEYMLLIDVAMAKAKKGATVTFELVSLSCVRSVSETKSKTTPTRQQLDSAWNNIFTQLSQGRDPMGGAQRTRRSRHESSPKQVDVAKPRQPRVSSASKKTGAGTQELGGSGGGPVPSSDVAVSKVDLSKLLEMVGSLSKKTEPKGKSPTKIELAELQRLSKTVDSDSKNLGALQDKLKAFFNAWTNHQKTKQKRPPKKQKDDDISQKVYDAVRDLAVKCDNLEKAHQNALTLMNDKKTVETGETKTKSAEVSLPAQLPAQFLADALEKNANTILKANLALLKSTQDHHINTLNAISAGNATRQAGDNLSMRRSTHKTRIEHEQETTPKKAKRDVTQAPTSSEAPPEDEEMSVDGCDRPLNEWSAGAVSFYFSSKLHDVSHVAFRDLTGAELSSLTKDQLILWMGYSPFHANRFMSDLRLLLEKEDVE